MVHKIEGQFKYEKRKRSMMSAQQQLNERVSHSPTIRSTDFEECVENINKCYGSICRFTERSFVYSRPVPEEVSLGNHKRYNVITSSDWCKPAARLSDVDSESIPSHLEADDKQAKFGGSAMSKDWRKLAFKLNYGLGEKRESWKGDYL